jgi:uncharacterized protein (TIGR03067 family)
MNNRIRFLFTGIQWPRSGPFSNGEWANPSKISRDPPRVRRSEYQVVWNMRAQWTWKLRKDFTLAAVAVAAILLACGCASVPTSDPSLLQGTWIGEEIGGEKGPCRMAIEGDTIKFQGTRQQDWYVGTLTLTPNANPRQALVLIGDCGARQYVNKTVRAIYKLEGKQLTLAHHEPGNPAAPAAFGPDPASQTRAFVFTRQ